MMKPEHYGLKLLGSFIIPGKCRSKSNFKPRGRYYPDPKLTAFHATVTFLAKASLGVKKSYKMGWVIIQIHSKSQVHIDLSNSPKSILDCLVNAQVFTDDKDVAVTVPFAEIGKEDKTEVFVYVK